MFCALSVWLLGLLAASPQLHAALHADADHTDHSCAVTLFSHGCENSLGAISLDCAPILFVAYETPANPGLSHPAITDRLPPGRGPPLS